VARGGGSLEDLWSFNEEIVVRAAAASEIPLISAVGHETDTTLIDFAADLRAPTPTAAAERAVPVRSDLLSQLASLAARHYRGLRRLMEERRTRVQSAARALPKPDEILQLVRQRHDTAAARLPRALLANLQQHRARLAGISAGLSLKPLRLAIGNDRKTLAALEQRAGRALRRVHDFKRQRFAGSAKLLASLSYKSVLQRGFALVRDAADNPVRAAAGVKPAAQLSIEFADGRIKVREGSGPTQGSLF
jgi:exodeoxyribonuclease VII large subunit